LCVFKLLCNITLIILGEYFMARLSLAELKAQFASEKEGGGGNSTDWKNYYAFWKMELDTTAIVRFLPDLDQDNPLGWYTENITHTLMINGKKKIVPCLQMYGESCPCCELSQKYYKEEGDNSANGKKYWKKKEILAQVHVVSSPFEIEDNGNPAKLIQLGPKIFKTVKTAITSGDIENDPDSFKGGYDFRIRKTKQGEYADYSTSSFAPKQSDVPEDVIAKLDLFNLNENRCKQISRDVMEALILADQTGASYKDEDGTLPSSTPAPAAAPAPAATPAATPAVNEVTQPVDTPAPAASKGNAILDQIRARAAAAAAAAAS
jgi:hypothetical protein